MSIADKLTYLNETKRQLREAINAVSGTGLTASDPFRRYSDSLWEIYILSNLFNAGQQGAWFDPSDISTLFQDAAGTNPVTSDGDPVGLMLDKSGNGNHASQPTSAERPVYRADGHRHWLDFDGIDDRLSFDPVNAETIIVACSTGSTASGILGGGMNSGATGYVGVGIAGALYRSNTSVAHTLPGQEAGNKVVTIHNSSAGLTRLWGNGQKSADELQKVRISEVRHISQVTHLITKASSMGQFCIHRT